MKRIIRNETEMKKWFEKNYKKLGYSKIIKKDDGIFPDYVMLKNNRKVKVELETLSSNFILHNHNKNNVDEVICIKKDIKINVPIKELKNLSFVSRTKRVSATIDNKTMNLLKVLLKKGNYRNKSHAIERAIELLAEEENKKK